MKHKYFVLLECLSFGIPFLGIIHDIDKFYPRAFRKYAQYHFGELEEKPWTVHHRSKKHHWEFWKGQPIPERYEREMIADWNATGVIRNNATRDWYSDNKERIYLNARTKQFVESYIYREWK